MSEEKRYSVYCHTNKLNGKRYIGVTSRPVHRRFGKNGSHYAQSRYFEKAIKKYGWDGFYHEVWHTNLTLEEVEEYERYYIAAFNTQNRNFGYNIQSGGFAAREMSEEGRKANGLAHSGPSCSNAVPVVSFDINGKRLRDFPYIKAACEYYQTSDSNIWSALSATNKTCCGVLFRYAKDVVGIEQMTDEYLNNYVRIRNYKNGKHAKCTNVVVFDSTGKKVREFESMKEAASFFGTYHGCISAATRGRIKSVHGCFLRLKSEVGDKTHIDVSNIYQSKNIGIDQLDTSGKLLRHFASLREAEKEVGGDHKAIKLNAEKGTMYRGFYWKFSRS